MSQAFATSAGQAGPEKLVFREAFPLECGRSLEKVTLAYETWGRPSAARDNAVFVCHALTGSAHAASRCSGDAPGWWEELIGGGRALDPDRHFIVCANALGSCYGSTGPASPDPGGGGSFSLRFPVVTTRDMVSAFRVLLNHLGVERLKLIIGGSLGAMLVWRWLVDFPDDAELGLPIAGTAQASPWVIALNTVARQAIVNDPAWRGGECEGRGPEAGFALARMIAMISYRSQPQFLERFGRERADPAPSRRLAFDNDFQVERYLRHQGEKVVRRFDARSYVYLTKAMDLHDVSAGYGSTEAALARIRARVLAVGIESDVLFDPGDLRDTVCVLRRLGRDVAGAEIHSSCGHDAFLVEHAQLNTIVSGFLEGRTPCEF